MEDTLGVIAQLRDDENASFVLILVLMEDTLGGAEPRSIRHGRRCLNPCSNGRYSRSYVSCWSCSSCCIVLILVLMEDTLGDNKVAALRAQYDVLILVLMEDTLGELKPTNPLFQRF